MNNKHLYSFQTALDNSVLVASTTPFLHDFSKHTKHHFNMDMEREKTPLLFAVEQAFLCYCEARI